MKENNYEKIIGLLVAVTTLIIFIVFQRDNICIWLGSVYILILKKYSKKYNLTLENGFRFTSVKFNTAIRYSILIVIGIISVKILNIPHGLWLLTTITVVGLPYKEETNKKGIHRVEGTSIGIIIFLIITFFTTSPLVMIAVTIISVYLSTKKCHIIYQPYL